MKQTLVMLSVLFATLTAHAATRAIMIPGKSAILIMEGFSSGGADPDVRRLYDSIAMMPIQQSGGEGKVMSTDGKVFNLTCTTRNSSANSIVCNITIKAAGTSKIELRAAEFHCDGADAKMLNEKLAGKNIRFDFVSTDGAMKIESTPEHFDFIYR